MLYAGAIILSIGVAFQCIVSILSLIISIMGKCAPILKMVFTNDEIAVLDNKVISTTKSLVILHNSGAVLGTALFLIIIWTSLVYGYQWAFWTLLFAGLWSHAFWLLSDCFIGKRTLVANLVFFAIFVLGITLAGYAILLI